MTQITATSAATTGTGAAPKTSDSSTTLGKDAFLKLLIGQLKYQNPLNPSDGQDYLSQMSQFSMVEQLTNLSGSQAQATSDQRVARCVSLIGRPVSYLDGDGNVQTGTVEQVSLAGTRPTLTISGSTGIDPDTVTEVR